jgi:tRNA pseudouridine32 synthase/23S rRNA pseudouridine746 synthase
MEKITFRTTVSAGTSESACDFLSDKTGLSKVRVKDAMNKGAVWIKKKSGGMKRLRRASASLMQGDRIEMYYDRGLLSLKPPEARCLSDQKHYSVWHKPAGLLAQGTPYGDHCSLMRQLNCISGHHGKYSLSIVSTGKPRG